MSDGEIESLLIAEDNLLKPERLFSMEKVWQRLCPESSIKRTWQSLDTRSIAK